MMGMGAMGVKKPAMSSNMAQMSSPSSGMQGRGQTGFNSLQQNMVKFYAADEA